MAIKVSFSKPRILKRTDVYTLTINQLADLKIPVGDDWKYVKISREQNHTRSWKMIMGAFKPIKKDYDKITAMDLERRLRLKGFNVTNFVL